MWIDPAKIEQVVSNLLSNAIKYSPPHTVVDIQLCQEHQRTNSKPCSSLLPAPASEEQPVRRARDWDWSSRRGSSKDTEGASR